MEGIPEVKAPTIHFRCNILISAMTDSCQPKLYITASLPGMDAVTGWCQRVMDDGIYHLAKECEWNPKLILAHDSLYIQGMKAEAVHDLVKSCKMLALTEEQAEAWITENILKPAAQGA